MSGEEEGFPQVPASEFFARMEAQQAAVMMANEDFGNRWNELMATAPAEFLVTLREAFAAIGNGEPHHATGLGNYFEGQLKAAAFFRTVIEPTEARDPQAHGFIPDADDLDNPFCTARDQSGTVCGLGPSNRRHQ